MRRTYRRLMDLFCVGQVELQRINAGYMMGSSYIGYKSVE